MSFRIAVVQPRCHGPGTDEANVADALRVIERSAGDGAHFICFPESYPGPWRMPASFDPTPAMTEAAARHKVHVVFGTIEPIDTQARAAHNLTCMAYPDGRPPGGRARWRCEAPSSSSCRPARTRASCGRPGARCGLSREEFNAGTPFTIS